MSRTYAGAQLRHLRESHAMSQVDLARVLSISPSYLNQLEHNTRPLTVPVLLRITEVFGVDAEFFAGQDSTRLAADVREAMLEQVEAGLVTPGQIAEFASNLPTVARSLVTLYQRYRAAVEQNAALAVEHGSGKPYAGVVVPHEEVRDFLNDRHNYIADLDEAAEQLASEAELRPAEMHRGLARVLAERHGVRVIVREHDGVTAGGEQHRYDPEGRLLTLSTYLRPGQQVFRMATQLALLEHGQLISKLAAEGDFSGEQARTLCRIGLARYYAGALILPYQQFRTAAEQFRYDIERLCDQFGVGFETVCHRLTTLQRPRARGIPFSFVRVDRAGNMSKWQSATGFHFPRTGGTCPLWTVYEAFSSPGKVLVQVVRMPDERQYLWVARTVSHRRGGHGQPRKTFAVALGCEARHAHRMVYSAGLNLDDREAATPIGMGCKICERTGCPQRAVPPIGQRWDLNEHVGTFAPYPLTEHRPAGPAAAPRVT